jgi:hypothetical protein
MAGPSGKFSGVKAKRRKAPEDVQGSFVMDHRPPFSTITSRYDDFLFASICEEANGMRLSVLSALARMNIDPWEEATRLAAMPRAIAEKALVSTLGLTQNKICNLSEAEAIGARLVRLLPQPSDESTTVTNNIEAVRAQRTRYFLLCVAIVISILSHHQVTKPNDVDSDPKLGTVSQSKSSSANSALPSVDGPTR